MNDTANTKAFPYQLARLSWIVGVIAIGLVALQRKILREALES